MKIRNLVIILAVVAVVGLSIGIFSYGYNDDWGVHGWNWGNNGQIRIDSNDEIVDMSFDGIKIQDGDNHISIGWNGIKVTDGNERVVISPKSLFRNGFFTGNFPWNINHKTYNIDEEKFIPLEGIESISAESSFIDMEFTSESRDDVYIKYSGTITANDLPVLKTDISNGRLSIRLTHNKNNYSSSYLDASLRIVLPESYRRNLDAATSSGDMTASNLSLDNITLEANSGDINVVGLSGSQIHLSASSGYITANKIQGNTKVQTNSSDIELNDADGNQVDISASSGYVTARNINGNVSVKTTSGDILLENISGEKTYIEASSGKIWSSQIKGDLESRTNSGDMEIKNVSGKNTVLYSSSGYIITEDISGDVEAQTSSGDMSFDLDSKSGNYKLNSSSGHIEIEFSSDASYKGSISTNSGHVNTDKFINVTKLDRGRYEFKTLSGDKTIDIITSSGDINLKE